MNNKQTFRVPESWDDITVSQYDELLELELNTHTIFLLVNALKSGNYISLNGVDYNDIVNMLAIMLDTTIDVVESMELSGIIQVLEIISSWIRPLKPATNQINFGKMDVGKFVDLESIIGEGLSKNMVRFINRLNDKDCSGDPITKHFDHFNAYLNWRHQLFIDFTGLFNDIDDEDSIDMKASTEITRENFNKKWNWYGFIYQLAGGDIMRMEPVTELGIVSALNFLSYEREKANLK